MLWTLAVILIALWLLGLVTSYTMGGIIHVLLVIAIALNLIFSRVSTRADLTADKVYTLSEGTKKMLRGLGGRFPGGFRPGGFGPRALRGQNHRSLTHLPSSGRLAQVSRPSKWSIGRRAIGPGSVRRRLTRRCAFGAWQAAHSPFSAG